MKIACKMKQKMIDFWLIVLNMVHRELKFIGYVMVIEFCYDSNCFIDWKLINQELYCKLHMVCILFQITLENLQHMAKNVSYMSKLDEK
jgi:hypothetical protein